MCIVYILSAVSSTLVWPAFYKSKYFFCIFFNEMPFLSFLSFNKCYSTVLKIKCYFWSFIIFISIVPKNKYYYKKIIVQFQTKINLFETFKSTFLIQEKGKINCWCFLFFFSVMFASSLFLAKWLFVW